MTPISVPRFRVEREFPPIHSSRSRVRTVRANGGRRYLTKGHVYNPDLSYVAANELIAALLAEHLGLPIQPFCVLSHAKGLLFGSEWLPEGKDVYFNVDTGVLARCINREIVYQVVAFDVWLLNDDRHQQNLMARGVQRSERLAGSAGDLKLLLCDHGNALVFPGQKPGDLVEYNLQMTVDDCVRNSTLAWAITDRSALDRAIQRIEAIETEFIREAVFAVPDEWLNDDEKEAIAKFLHRRRTILPRLFDQISRETFQRLED